MNILKVIFFVLGLCASMAGEAVEFYGAFASPGNYEVTRLSEGLALAKPQQAYYLGGLLARPILRNKQQRLKDSVLYDLRLAAGNGRAGMKNHLLAMAAKITSMPVTGRKIAEFNPEVLHNNFSKDIPLEQDDSIYLPLRSAGVYVTGAVQRSGMFQSKSGDMRVSQWIKKLSILNPRLDWVWVAQPDGTVHKVAVAAWNRTRYPEVVMAPGAILFVPFSPAIMRGVEPGFGRRLITWLATQRLTSVLGI